MNAAERKSWLLRTWHDVLAMFAKLPEPPAGARCKGCAYFEDFGDDDQMGYCAHPFHRTWKSPHQAYGGHWTHEDSNCEMWKAR